MKNIAVAYHLLTTEGWTERAQAAYNACTESQRATVKTKMVERNARAR